MGKNKELKDHISRKEAFSRINIVFEDYKMLIKEWISDYAKIILPLILLILVSLTVIISLNAREKVDDAAKEALEVLEETKTEVQEIQETLFEEDKFPQINQLIYNYYSALEVNDKDALLDIQSSVSTTESIRLEKMSEYIERYENIKVYSKPGPYVDTYIVYVYSDAYLVGREEAIPGLQAFYICMDEFGNYYINTSELNDEEALYIETIAEQSDVIELKNSVNVAYKTLMEQNEELIQYWAAVSVDIDLAVGNQLAIEAQMTAMVENEISKSEEPDTEEPVEEENKEPEIIKVKTNSKVNVRKSASATADKLGSAALGEVFVVEEELENGWTKIDYNGKTGYIKSEFLDKLENIDDLVLIGKVVSTTTLNVRSEASMTASKIGVLSEGQSVDLIAEEDGWCKIKFDGQVGYVKSDYVK